jgi:anti-sigma B factor antagonist
MTAVLPSVSTFAPNPHPLLLTVTARTVPPDAVVLEVRGEVDLSTTPFLQNALLAHLHDAATRVTRVAVDLTGVSFLSAAGLTVLVNVKQAAVAAGSSLCLVACTRVVLLPLTITGLDAEFDIRHVLPSPGGGPDG